MPLNHTTIEALRAAASPQAHGGGQGLSQLLIQYCTEVNRLASISAPCWIISDWAGYVSATSDPAVLAEAIRLESEGGIGTFRKLIFGESPWEWAEQATRAGSPGSSARGTPRGTAQGSSLSLTLEDLNL